MHARDVPQIQMRSVVHARDVPQIQMRSVVHAHDAPQPLTLNKKHQTSHKVWCFSRTISKSQFPDALP